MPESTPKPVYLSQRLSGGENLVHWTRQHWSVLIPGAIFAAIGVALLVGVLAAMMGGDSEGDTSLTNFLLGLLVIPAFCVTGIVLLLVAWAERTATEYAITNRRVLCKTGLLSRKTWELELKQVETTEFNQGVLDRLFGAGSIRFIGTGGSGRVFEHVENAEWCHKVIREQLQKNAGLPQVGARHEKEEAK